MLLFCRLVGNIYDVPIVRLGLLFIGGTHHMPITSFLPTHR